MKKIFTLLFIFMILSFLSVSVMSQVNWDFEDGNDHKFSLWSVSPATPAPDDPTTAGDESVTGIGGDNGLPAAGIAWSIGPPDQFEGLAPAVNEGCHVVEGVLVYSDCNDPFGVATGDPPYDFTNSRGQSGYLNTYALSQWGDNLHAAANDQIATSPPVLLSNGAELTVWSTAGGGTYTVAPALDANRANGYVDNSSGIAVLLAVDSSFLTSVLTQNPDELIEGVLPEHTLDLSAFAGQTVIIEVVDAFEGPWGWLAIDEIEITNAMIVGTTSATSMTYALMQNYPNPFKLSTTIEYTVTRNTHAEIVVYDVLGHKIATLVNEYKNSGTYKVVWDASNLASGVYIYQLKTDDFTETKTMKLIK